MTKEQCEIAKEVIRQVNKYFETDCTVKSRKTNIVRPRMYACKIIRELTDMIYQDIGDLFVDCWNGEKTHDNVIYAIKKVDNDLETNKKYKVYYIELRAIIEATDVYKNSNLIRKSIISDIRREFYNIIMEKDIEELKQLLKTIT